MYFYLSTVNERNLSCKRKVDKKPSCCSHITRFGLSLVANTTAFKQVVKKKILLPYLSFLWQLWNLKCSLNVLFVICSVETSAKD